MAVLSRISYPVQKRIITVLLVLGGVAILTNVLFQSSGETHFWSSSTNWVGEKYRASGVADGVESIGHAVEGIWGSNHDDEQYNLEMADGHPIAKLIRKAETMQYLEDEKRSTTLEEAVKHYKEKWGRLPPPGFDKVCFSPFSVPFMSYAVGRGLPELLVDLGCTYFWQIGTVPVVKTSLNILFTIRARLGETLNSKLTNAVVV